MVIFYSYVSLPEGMTYDLDQHRCLREFLHLSFDVGVNSLLSCLSSERSPTTQRAVDVSCTGAHIEYLWVIMNPYLMKHMANIAIINGL